MSFTCKIILSHHAKPDKSRRVYLQAIIDRKRAIVPLGFCVKEDSFDQRRQCMKTWHPNAKTYDTEFQLAIAKANNIASKFRIDGKFLTPESFKNEYTNPTEKVDLITFIKTELELKRVKLAKNTYKQHNTVVNKLREFKSVIPFGHLTIEMMQKFENSLIKAGNGGPTVNKLLKIVKQYLSDARKKGITFKDPFDSIKIKTFKSNRLALSQEEVDRLEKYYDSPTCLPAHKKLLRYFLFSCHTALRISDVQVITWNNVHGDLLIFVPAKTKYTETEVKVPISARAKKYLPAFTNFKAKIFDTFADQVSNRYLKRIAKLDTIDIRKKITYHTSRHTFGSLFAEGGNIVALQKIMGHGDIKTTMGYVHTSTKNLIDAVKQRFGTDIPVKNDPSN